MGYVDVRTRFYAFQQEGSLHDGCDTLEHHGNIYNLYIYLINPLLHIEALNNLNLHPLEVVSRYRDSQLQVGENYL